MQERQMLGGDIFREDNFMLKYYNYIYYKLYAFFLKEDKNDIPQWNALIILSGWIVLDIVIVKHIFEQLHLFPTFNISKTAGIAMYLLICFGNLFLFIRNKKYNLIKADFDTHSLFSNKTKERIFVWAFLLLPFLIAVIFALV